MIKGFILLVRREDISEQQFSEHWYTVHGPLALRLKTLRAYVQSHRIDEAIPGFNACTDYTGIAEIWMRRLEDAQNIPFDPDYIEGLYEDEPNFLVREKTRYLFTEEYSIIEAPHLEPGDHSLVKSMYLTRRHPDLSVSEFQDHWLNRHAPLVLDTPGLLGYTQAHVLPASYETEIPLFDGVAELWWPDLDTFLAAWNSPEHQQAQLEDLQTFIDMDRTEGLLVNPRRLL